MQERCDGNINALKDRGDSFTGSITEKLFRGLLAMEITKFVDGIIVNFTSSDTAST